MVSFSVLIITHGREDLLGKCLDSLPASLSDWTLIILANGKELSPSLIEKAQKAAPIFELIKSDVVLPPGKARNLTLEKVSTEWIYLIDDDAYTLTNYWETVLPLLNEPKIDVLGGPDSPAAGMNALSHSLAMTLSSPFCTGATFSRHKSLGSKMVLADEEKLTSCNLWIRTRAIKGERFPEDYQRAEETLFLQRLRHRGAHMFYHPKLRVGHFRRKKFSELLRPTFLAGHERSKLLREKLASGAEVFWLPSVFVLLHLLYFIEPITFWSLARIYTGIILFVSIGFAVKAKKIWLFPVIAFLHYFIVFTYGLGFLYERMRLK